MTAPPDDTTTDLHAVVAALQQRLDAGLAREAALAEALATRNTDYGERIDHQAATIDVLKAMSASPGDPQPVFDLIARRARNLCGGAHVGLFEFDGTLIHIRAWSGIYHAGIEFRYPKLPTRDTISSRAILERRIFHIRDADTDLDLLDAIREAGSRSILSVPLMRDGAAVGAISLNALERGGFSDGQVELLKTFAEQAVIAISSAETYCALQTRTRDLQETLEYQTATSDVLKVISRSTFDLQPVLDTLVETAARLCDADQALISRREGEVMHFAANYGFPPEYETYLKARGPVKLDPGSPTVAHRTLIEGRPVHIDDVTAVPGYPEVFIRLGKHRTSLGVPLLRGGDTIGFIQLSRQQVEPFTDRQIALVSTFADQAVIAIENTRLITEQREALEQQTATAEVLQVINASPGDLTPVFDAVLDKALRLCDANFGHLATFDGVGFRAAAWRGFPPEPNRPVAPPPPTPGMALYRLIHGEEVVHIPDITADEVYRSGNPGRRRMADEFGGRTAIWVALKKDTVLLGAFVVYRTEVRPFSNKRIALLQNFAAQAVIAMENARLLGEIRQREEELRVTFENMGDGVAMFDGTPRLVAWNRKFQDILDVPNEALAVRRTFDEYIRYLTERGEFGQGAEQEEQVRRIQATRGHATVFERTRPNGGVIEVRQNPVPGGGFVLIYADITERKRNEAEIRAARDAAEEASRTIEAAYRELKTAQANLIQAEKMASLGQLTAGIAHEIKNPLNFVNNFAALSVDLLGELKETAAPGFAALTEKQRAEVEEVSVMLTSNLEKITEHGKRADGIVKAMLEHSRGSSGERRMVDLNAVIDEALNLAYHGARAQDQSFNITLERDLGKGIAPIEVNPQDMTRVFLNIFSNGFYAATRRARDDGDAGFVPMLKVTTRDASEAVEIRVRDNGTGIRVEIRNKLFQPFFTTKPTGEGTGLGLSITYDIVTKQHGGTISVDSEVDSFTEFVVTLPRKIFATEGDRA